MFYHFLLKPSNILACKWWKKHSKLPNIYPTVSKTFAGVFICQMIQSIPVRPPELEPLHQHFKSQGCFPSARTLMSPPRIKFKTHSEQTSSWRTSFSREHTDTLVWTFTLFTLEYICSCYKCFVYTHMS